MTTPVTHLARTLGGKSKLFHWNFDPAVGLRVIKEFKDEKSKVDLFAVEQIDQLIKYVQSKDRLPLANSVSKIHEGREKDGLGSYFFREIENDIGKAQSMSQFAAVMVKSGIFGYNGRTIGMEFWVVDSNWRERLSTYNTASEEVEIPGDTAQGSVVVEKNYTSQGVKEYRESIWGDVEIIIERRATAGGFVEVSRESSGELHGPQREWYPSGQIKAEESYELGYRKGWQRSWFESGQLKQERCWDYVEVDRDDCEVGTEEVEWERYPNDWFVEGRLTSEYVHGIERSWYENGELAHCCEFSHGHIVGRYEAWHENGCPKVVAHFALDKSVHIRNQEGDVPGGIVRRREDLQDIFLFAHMLDGEYREWRDDKTEILCAEFASGNLSTINSFKLSSCNSEFFYLDEVDGLDYKKDEINLACGIENYPDFEADDHTISRGSTGGYYLTLNSATGMIIKESIIGMWLQHSKDMASEFLFENIIRFDTNKDYDSLSQSDRSADVHLKQFAGQKERVKEFQLASGEVRQRLYVQSSFYPHALLRVLAEGRKEDLVIRYMTTVEISGNWKCVIAKGTYFSNGDYEYEAHLADAKNQEDANSIVLEKINEQENHLGI